MIETNKNEQWKSAVGYEQYLEVSTLGRVRRISHSFVKRNGRICKVKSCILKPNHSRKGYLLVNVKGGKLVSLHRLVAMAFIPNPKNLPEINHIDENKENNKISNLEWCTHKENSQHGTRNKRISETLKNSLHNKKPIIRSDGVKFLGLADAARAVDGYPSNICKCLKGIIRSAYGYQWRYANEDDVK